MNEDKGAGLRCDEVECQGGLVAGENTHPMCAGTDTNAIATDLTEVNSWGRRVSDDGMQKKPSSTKEKKGRREKAGLRPVPKGSPFQDGRVERSVENTWESNTSDGRKIARSLKEFEKGGRARNRAGPMLVRIKLTKAFYRKVFRKNGMLNLCSYCHQTKENAPVFTDDDGHSTTSNAEWRHDPLCTESTNGSRLNSEAAEKEYYSRGASPCRSRVPGCGDSDSSMGPASSIEMKPAALRDPSIDAAIKPVNNKNKSMSRRKSQPDSLSGVSTGASKPSRARASRRHDKSQEERSTDDSSRAASFSYDQLEVRPSKIHGLGIFTRSRIPEGCLLMKYEGEIIGKCTSDKRERNYLKNNIKSVYMFRVDDDTIIDATFIGNKARYINHSCDPNCFSITDTSSRSIVYYSMRAIEPGEELSIDYHFTEEHPSEVCCCGSVACKS